jgi:hypothetical protein
MVALRFHHVPVLLSGISRNVFAPVLSGGGVVCCPGFDAGLWWDIASQHKANW